MGQALWTSAWSTGLAQPALEGQRVRKPSWGKQCPRGARGNQAGGREMKKTAQVTGTACAKARCQSEWAVLHEGTGSQASLRSREPQQPTAHPLFHFWRVEQSSAGPHWANDQEKPCQGTLRAANTPGVSRRRGQWRQRLEEQPGPMTALWGVGREAEPTSASWTSATS